MNLDAWIESNEVTGFAGNSEPPIPTCGDDNSRIDHVVGPGCAAQQASRFGRWQVEGLDDRFASVHNTGNARLTPTIAPNLAHHSRRNHNGLIHVRGDGKERKDSSVRPLDGDQCASIEDDGSSVRRAHDNSSSVSGDPASIAIARTTSPSDSAAALASIASATHALTDGARPDATSASADANAWDGTVTVTLRRVRIQRSYRAELPPLDRVQTLFHQGLRSGRGQSVTGWRRTGWRQAGGD